MAEDGLEVLSQFCEAADDQQLLARWRRVYFLVLENPGRAVRHENGVQSGGQRGIDVGFGAIADHPRGIVLQLKLFDRASIGALLFLSDDFRCGEIFLQSRALDLSGLLGYGTLRHQTPLMSLR